MGIIERLRASGHGFAVGLALVALYAALRTLGLPDPFGAAWVAAAVLATLAWPVAGLTVLATIGPFTEALTAGGAVTAVPFLLAALGIATLVRVALARPLPRPSLPLVLAIVLLCGTAAGIAVSAVNHGLERGVEAAQMWVPGIGGALTILLGAAWLAWRGEVRPIYVAVASVTLGALLTIANAATDNALGDSVIGWLLRPDSDPRRVSGLLPAPNATSALFAAGIAVSVALAASRSSITLRASAAVAAMIQAMALILTFSRSGVLGLGVAAAILAWHRWRRIGIIVAGAAVILGIGLAALTGLVREVPFAADQARATAWEAGARMWLANPVFGAGFRSFEWQHAAYGSAILDAPHNEWLRLLAEEGTLVGLAGIAFALITPIWIARAPGWIAAGAGAAAASLFVVACFNNPFIYAQLNVPAFLIIGTGLGVAQRVTGDRSGAQRTPISSLDRSTRST